MGAARDAIGSFLVCTLTFSMAVSNQHNASTQQDWAYPSYEGRHDNPENAARDYLGHTTGGTGRRLLGSSASRKLLDHTVTHNIEMLKDVREYERLQMLSKVENYQDARQPKTYLGRFASVSSTPASEDPLKNAQGVDIMPEGPSHVTSQQERQGWNGEDMAVRNVLMQLFWEWNGYEWTSHLRWPGREWRKPSHYCTWFGLSCTDDGVLTSMQLESNNLIGTIPASIGELTTLVELHLGFNFDLVGSLPESIGKLTKLSYLSLPYTGLTGAPPSSLINLKSLNYADFRYIGDNYIPMNVKDPIHEISSKAKFWNQAHFFGKLTKFTGWDPYCHDGYACVGTSLALGTYWSQPNLHMDLHSWTTKGRHGTTEAGCDGPTQCNEHFPGHSGAKKLDTTNSIDPSLTTMTPRPMG